MIKIILFLLAAALTGCASQATPNQTPGMYSKLGDIYSQGNRFAEAENYYQRAYESDPANAKDTMLKIADAQIKQGKFAQAITTYNKILLNEPKNHEARYQLAKVHMSTGELTFALSEYQQLLKINKQDVNALNGLGVLLDNLSQTNLAKNCYQQGLQYSPNNYALLNNLGVSYAISGDLNSSEKYLNQASQQSLTLRPKKNYELIASYYEKIKDAELRQQGLKKSLLLKNVVASKSLVSEAAVVAKQWCGQDIKKLG